MSNRFDNGVGYASVDGAAQDVDMLDVGSGQHDENETSKSCATREDQDGQVSQTSAVSSENHINRINLPLLINKHPFATIIQYLVIGKSRKETLLDLKREGVFHHLRVLQDTLKLDANGPGFSNGSPLDHDSPGYEQAIRLLSVAHDLSADKPVLDREGDMVVIHSQEHRYALRHLRVARGLLCKWLVDSEIWSEGTPNLR